MAVMLFRKSMTIRKNMSDRKSPTTGLRLQSGCCCSGDTRRNARVLVWLQNIYSYRVCYTFALYPFSKRRTEVIRLHVKILSQSDLHPLQHMM